MSSEAKVTWTLIVVIAAAVAGFYFYPSIKHRVLLPTPHRAWVAVEVEGSRLAEVGWQRIPSGTPFTLRAVVEADAGGETVYYTEAERLSIHGSEVSPKSLRRWDRSWRTRIRWFSVEGSAPYSEVETVEEVETFELKELYRADWPTTWSIPGRLEPYTGASGGRITGGEDLPLGTLRYHVRVELYRDDEALVPDERYKSWGAADLREQAAEFPGVTAYLPGVLQPPSEAFGLPQLEAVGEDRAAVLVAILEQARRHLAFGRLPLIRQMAAAAGTEVEDLEWRPLDLATRPAWGERVQPGDLLQVLDRIVVLYQDQGEPGVLDAEDLCFDFAKGAAVRPLGQVFSGDGEVSWVPLRPAASV